MRISDWSSDVCSSGLCSAPWSTAARSSRRPEAQAPAMPDPISWEFAWPYLAAALVGGYLLGSVPFGLLLTRMAGLGDLLGSAAAVIGAVVILRTGRSEEHTSELQSLMRISYAVFCLKKKKQK